MKKINIVSWAIVICMIVAASVSIFFLPSELAVQWNTSGISNKAAKWIIFLFPAIAAFCMGLKKVRVSSNSSNMSVEACVYFIVLLLVCAAEIIIIFNGFTAMIK